jgi:hypothetical protein
MLNHLIGEGPYAQGTICAFFGLCIVSALNFRGWRQLETDFVAPSGSAAPQMSPTMYLLARKNLFAGMGLTLLFLLLVGALDAGGELLDRIVGGLMGLCGAMALGILGVGFVAMRNLWKELIAQLKSARISQLLLSVPLAALYLALGIGIFVLIGFFLDEIPKVRGMLHDHPFWRIGGALLGAVIIGVMMETVWHVIATMFERLWGGRSHAALFLRLILMVVFSAIMIPAAVFLIWFAAEQIAPLQVAIFCVILYANVLFYSRWVRLEALKDNFREPPDFDLQSKARS